MLIPQKDLLSLLRYDPDTGYLYWLERGPEWFAPDCRFSPESHAAMWNGRNAGKRAFSRPRKGMYYQGFLLGRPHLAHRVIWKMVTGLDPNIIDHINGNGLDNRIDNLRSVSVAENAKNRGRRSRPESPAVGVYRSHSKWKAVITVNGKVKYLGVFDTIDQAKSAREKAKILYGFHPNHGEERTGAEHERGIQ